MQVDLSKMVNVVKNWNLIVLKLASFVFHWHQPCVFFFVLFL